MRNSPGTAVNEDEDRSIRAFGAINVELFDLGRTIRFTLWHPQLCARALAIAGPARDILAQQRRIETLIVSRIQFHLVHVHPNQGTLLVLWRPDPAFFR